ncbi:MAG: ATP-dependent helicase [Dehalococcoidia bacterium]
MSDLLKGLNPAQRQAVEAIEGPLLILAGPGSGKTRVITHRVAYLVKVCGVSPHRIMAVTFTNKAAREMKERLYRLVGKTVETVTLGTFHAICARILRVDGEPVGLSRNLVIFDSDDQVATVKRAMQELGVDPKSFAPRSVLAAISAAKSQLIGVEEHHRHCQTYFDEVVDRVYQRYEELLRDSNGVDFDDLLLKAVQLLEKTPPVLEKYTSRYVHLLIDEFQDTNLVQYELAKQLASRHRNICVVGDPDQSIYSWRYADIRNILNFEKDYPDAKVVFLEQNYRSTQNILEGAHNVISANEQRKEKSLWTKNKEGAAIAVAEAYTEQEEAQLVAREVERLVGGERHRMGDCAIMYRTNAQSRAIEEAFLRYGIPYKLVAGTRFYERREVKDIIAYLRLVHNPHDNISLMRVINVPGRGIGQRTTDELTRWSQELGVPHYTALQMLADGGGKDKGDEVTSEHALSPRIARSLTNFLNLVNDLMEQARDLDVVKLIDAITERAGYRDYLLESNEAGEERWENVLELRSVAGEYRHLPPEEGLASLLEGVALVSDVDDLDEKVDSVTLITLHQAKGLEFPVVFIVGMEEGILPHMRSFDDPAQMEEERRLCYVGMTRAKERLYLVRAFRRTLMGSSTVNPPSRFLEAIPSHLTTTISRLSRGIESRQSDQWWSAQQKSDEREAEFKAGDQVRHAVFGDGVVVGCKSSGSDHEVTVAFKGSVGMKRLLLSYAPLEKIS